MADARDLAADLLADFDPRRARVREALAAVRDTLGDGRDRALLTELCYGVIRRLGTLDAILARASKRELAKLDPAVRVALRLGLYQILFLDRVPTHAAVDHAVGYAGARVGEKAAGYTNGVLRGLARDLVGTVHGEEDPRRDVPLEGGGRMRFARAVFGDPRRDEARTLGQRYGVPRWLVARWHKAFGKERTADILRAAITRPGLTLRARQGRDALVEALRAEGLEARHGAGNTAVELPGSAQVEPLIDSGRAWVQDATSQRVVPLLQVAPGLRVLDLCAAPGGKTVQIADALAGQGALVATDVDPAKIETLQALAGHLHGIPYEARQIEPEGPLPFEPGSFDRVLVDAPCTNTGVLRRRVEVRARLSPRDLERLPRLQRDLLARAWPLVAPGGALVYATCSLEPEENESLVESFVADTEGVRLCDSFRAFPSASADGGYAARLIHA